MIVTIKTYDPLKGRGFYETSKGSLVPFSYKDFCGEKLIPTGSKARMVGTTLCPYYSPWQYFVQWVKEVLSGYCSK